MGWKLPPGLERAVLAAAGLTPAGAPPAEASRRPRGRVRQAVDPRVQLVTSWCTASGIPPPQSEFPLGRELGRKWALDMAWPSEGVALEIHGSVHTAGHHVRGRGFEDDREKLRHAVIMGWRVLEYSTGQFASGAWAADLERLLGQGE